MGGVGVNTGSWEEALPANLPAKLWVGWVLTQGLGQKLNSYLPSCGWGRCKHRVWGRSSASKLTCHAVVGVGVNTGSGAETLPANLPAKLWVGLV